MTNSPQQLGVAGPDWTESVGEQSRSAPDRDESAVPVRSARARFACWFGHPLIVLSLITLLGTGLRLVSLDRPALWGDEAFTFSRVCGSYRQLLDVLRTDGFMPLHYSLYWWVGQHWDLSPIAMRLPVAIAGMLMPPAMYFLARQMRVSTSAALLVAFFTACSAYLLTYSRDAKMYMPFWLFAAVHAGCLLWWLNGVGTRPGRRADSDEDETSPSAIENRSSAVPAHFRYFCWLAAGVAMIGFHAGGLALLGVEAVMLLGWLVRRWPVSWRSVLRGGVVIVAFALGAGVIAGAAWTHFTKFSSWADRAGEQWNTTGLGWVPLYNAERDGWEHLKFTATAFAFSWEWPNRSKIPGVDPRAMKLLSAAAVVIGAAALVGLLPWRRRRGATRPAVGIPSSNAAGVDGGAERGVEGGVDGGAEALVDRDGRNTAWPRTLFWVLVWLALPTYAVYCRSIQPFVAPWTWLGDGWAWARGLGWTGLGGAVAVAVLCVWRSGLCWRDRGLATLALVGVLAAVFALLCVEYAILQHLWESARENRKPWRNVWMPRYLGFVWPAFAIALCVLLMRLPTRPIRWGAIAVLIGVNLVQFSVRVWGGSEPPTDRLASDLAEAQPMHVRGQQLSADLARQTGALVTGQRTRFARIDEQVRKQPLIDPDVRVYTQTGAWSPEPGGGVIGSFAARYYLVWLIGIEASPPEFRRFRAAIDRQWVVPIGLSPRGIASDMTGQRYAGIRRMVTWDRIDPGARDNHRDDPVGRALGSAWRREQERTFTVRDHWTWRHLYTLRRREYVRVQEDVPPATRPVTQPAASAPTTKPATGPSNGPTLPSD